MGAADVDLSGSIDLRPLPISPDFTAYVNESARPVAAGETGRPWLRMDRGYSGATGGGGRRAAPRPPRGGGGARPPPPRGGGGRGPPAPRRWGMKRLIGILVVGGSMAAAI